MPFDRLILAVDAWAAGRRVEHRVFAQIGESPIRPPHIEYVALLDPMQFRQRVQWADALVAHAGMGSILTALQYGKPILVMPRQGRFLETRNDHQVATAVRFREMGKVAVAMDENEIPAQLDGLETMSNAERISDRASDALLAAVRGFIHGKAP